MESEGFTGDGRFEIQRRLGEGGFGTVYAAFDREFGVPVALKHLRLHTPEALYRFKKEFRSLAGVIHPNLVSLYELFQVSEDLYFTMELIQGRHLFEHLRPGQPIGADDATVLGRRRGGAPLERRVPLALPDLGRLRATFVQLARALHALHSAGLLHRDIKSSNVLVTDEGRVVVLDFGLVTETKPADEGDGMVVGTPHYMSPEQWMGGVITEASDWYSFGVVLYEALTGIAPFEGTPTDLAINKLKGEPLAPRALDSQVPEDLDALCRRLLSVDPGSRPKGPEVIRALGGDQAEPEDEQAPRTFVGRMKEMSSLLDAFHTSLGGHGTTVHLHGDSGIGKTALFDHFAGVVAASHQPVILRGRSYAQESLPYKALDGAMDELSRFLAAKPLNELSTLLPENAADLACLFPTLRRVPPLAHAGARADDRPALEVRRSAAAVLRQLLALIAIERPVIIYLDDVHWGDVDSVDLIHDLMHAPEAPPILLVLSYVDEDQQASPFLRALHALEVVSGPLPSEQRIALGRITAADCEDLAASLLQRRPVKPGALTRIAREAGGNPLFVEELVRFARTGEEAPHDADDDTLDTEERNVLLNGVVQRRVGELPPQWQRLVEVLGVAAQPIDVDVAQKAAGLDALDGTMLNRMRAGHLVRTRYLDGREQIATYHDRIRAIVVGALEPAQRERLHGALAEALVKSNRARPGIIANHLRLAGELDRAADYAFQAAEQAAGALAFEDAADLYGKVLAWKRGDPDHARRLLRKHADALANAGRCADAAPRYLEAADGADATEAIDLKRLACEQYLMGGMTDEGMRILEELCAAVGVSCPRTPTRAVLAVAGDLFRLKLRGLKFQERSDREVPRAELVRIDVCFSAGRNLLLRDPMLAARFNSRALRLALDAGEPNRIVEGLASMGTGLTMQNMRDGAKMLARAREIAERVGTPTMRGLLLLWSAFVEHGQAHWTSSLAAWDEAVALLASTTGVTSEKQKAQLNGILAVQLLGRFDELRRRTERAMTEARATGNRYTEVYARLYSAIPLLAAGDVQACRARIADALQRSPEGDHYVRVTALKFECYCDLYQGRALDALQRLEAAWPGIVKSQMLRVSAFRVAFHTLRAGVALQARAQAPDRAAALYELAEGEAHRLARDAYPYAVAQAAMVQAAISIARGDRAAAIARTGEALQAFESAGVEMEPAYARRWLGLLRDNDEGAALVARADTFLRSRAVADPARFVASQTPGFLPLLTRDPSHVTS